MSPRRPTGQFDIERFMKRVRDEIDQAFEPVIGKLGDLQSEIRKGNMDTELLTRRVTDLENQVIESRQHLQVTERASMVAAQAVAATAVTTAQAVADTAVDAASSLAKAAPRNVWKTKLGLITAGSAAFVAVVAFFNNLPQFVRGASEVVVKVFSYIVSKK